MNTEIGVYRGSFDPPHNGHLEAVRLALEQGMSSVIVVYKDLNPSKPFRNSDKTRKELLKALFQDLPSVTISKKSYKATLSDLLENPSIKKIYQILGSDLLKYPVRPIKLPTKLCYFIHVREDFPVDESLKHWNNLPVKIGKGEKQHFQVSSSKIKSLLFEKKFDEALKYVPSLVFDKILNQKILTPTENEYRLKDVLQFVKKAVQDEIVEKNLVATEKFPLSFHVGQDIGISGLSGDVICFIKDKHQETFLVIKIFLSERFQQNYSSELSGYRILRELNLKLIKVPQIYFSCQRPDLAFIGMSFVPGKTLAQMLGRSSNAISLSARANLELHKAAIRQPKEISAQQVAHFDETLKKLGESMESLNGAIFTKDLIGQMHGHWEKIRSAFLVNPGALSFTHGDPNHHNWIIDLENEQVAYIDLSLFDRSISLQQGPCGFPANELYEALLTLRIAAMSRGGFTEEQIHHMQRSYRKEYLANAPSQFITKDAEKYFSAYWTLRVMENLIAKMRQASSINQQLKYQNDLLTKIKTFLNQPEYE